MQDKIISYLTQKYNPEVILLGGSRSTNTHCSSSDWDIYLIGDYQVENEMKAEEFDGEQLDIALFPRNSLENNVLKIYFGPLKSLTVLKDNSRKLGEKILNATRKSYEEGPQYSQENILESFQYLKRIYGKIIKYQDSPIVGNYHFSNFYREVFPFWFMYQNKWSVPLHYAIEEIQECDPDFYELVTIFTGKYGLEKKTKTCEKVLIHLKNNLTSK